MASSRDQPIQFPYFDLLRLAPSELQAILADIRPNGEERDERQKRQHERSTYQEEALLLFEVKSKDNSTPFLVKCVDISAGGLGLLHGGFVHTGLPCVITLVTRKKSGLRIKGKIARCIHVRRHVHLVGVQFNEAIDAEQLARLEIAA